MKYKNCIVAIISILVSSAAAFATTKNVRVINIFYKTTGTGSCLQGTVLSVCPFINIPDCFRVITPISGPPIIAPIYASRVFSPRTNQFECADPYSDTEPAP